MPPGRQPHRGLPPPTPTRAPPPGMMAPTRMPAQVGWPTPVRWPPIPNASRVWVPRVWARDAVPAVPARTRPAPRVSLRRGQPSVR
jgi:hypothetical protein